MESKLITDYKVKTISLNIYYPKLDFLNILTNLAQPISNLYIIGDIVSYANDPKVAIVGSRKNSSYGEKITYKIAYDLAKAGVVIVSGLALGIDTIAHTAALDAGGKTIAVLPSGLNNIYPKANRDLANRIVMNGGALISEYPNTNVVQKYQFIARNRIIAAISNGVLITEAAEKSGSLHTANFALDLGLDIFSVPGNIDSNNSIGTNKLIASGAIPVTNAQDIMDVIL